MTARVAAAGLALLVLAATAPALAWDPQTTFTKGGLVVSAEGGGGRQDNINDGFESGLEFWNVGARLSWLPWGVTGTRFFRGALELGLEPFYQRYTEPHPAFFAGLGAVGRFYVLSLSLDRLVPYFEGFVAAAGTDLKTPEIRSDFTFLFQAGPGLTFFVTDRAAVYTGYRFQHVSNGGTDTPNHGFESHTGVLGVSVFFP